MNPFRRFRTMHKGWFRILISTYSIVFLLMVLLLFGSSPFSDAATALKILTPIWFLAFWPLARIFFWIKDGFSHESSD